MKMAKEKTTKQPSGTLKPPSNTNIFNIKATNQNNIINKKLCKRNLFVVFCYDSEAKKFKVHQVSFVKKYERYPGGGLGIKPRISRSISCLVIPNSFYNQNRLKKHEKKADSQTRKYEKCKRSLHQTSSSESNYSVGRDSVEYYKENVPNILSKCRRRQKYSLEPDCSHDEKYSKRFRCHETTRSRNYNDEDDRYHERSCRRQHQHYHQHHHQQQNQHHNSHRRSDHCSYNQRGHFPKMCSKNRYEDDRPRRSRCPVCHHGHSDSEYSNPDPPYTKRKCEHSSSRSNRQCRRLSGNDDCNKRYRIRSHIKGLRSGGGTKIRYNLRRNTSGCCVSPDYDQYSDDSFRTDRKRHRSKTVNFHDDYQGNYSHVDHDLLEDNIPYKFIKINPRYSSVGTICSECSFGKSNNNLYNDIYGNKRMSSGSVACDSGNHSLKKSNASYRDSPCYCQHRKHDKKSLKEKISNLLKSKYSKKKKHSFHATELSRYDSSCQEVKSKNSASKCFKKIRRNISCIIKRSELSQGKSSIGSKYGSAMTNSVSSRNTLKVAYPTNYKFQRGRRSYRDSDHYTTRQFSKSHRLSRSSRMSSDESYDESSSTSSRENAGHLHYDSSSSDCGYEHKEPLRSCKSSTQQVKPSNIRLLPEKEESCLKESLNNIPKQPSHQNNFSMDQCRGFSCPVDSETCCCCNLRQGKLLEDLKKELLDKLIEDRNQAVANATANCSFPMPCSNFGPATCMETNNLNFCNPNWLTLEQSQPQMQLQPQIQLPPHLPPQIQIPTQPNETCAQTPFYGP